MTIQEWVSDKKHAVSIPMKQMTTSSTLRGFPFSQFHFHFYWTLQIKFLRTTNHPPDNPWSYRWKNWHIWPGWWNKASRWWNWRRPDKYFEWTYFHSLEIIWSFNFPFYQLFFISLLYMCCQRWMKDYRSLLYRNPDSTQIRTLNSTIASQAFVHVALVIFLKFVPVVLTKSSL